jgi:predicted metal-binding membrane protein
MDMGGMDMTGFRIIPSGMGFVIPARVPWLPMEFAFVFAMWTVMMVGMMTPSAVPMFLTYARIERQTGVQGRLLTATVWFVVGYFVVWAAFSALATLAQWAVERTALLDDSMATTSKVLGGCLFVAAGAYEWTRLKEICLTQCQKPFEFVMSHGGFRRDVRGSLTLGLRHGAYCVGCCGLLTALLFVGGLMNLLWVVLLALFIFLQKFIPSGDFFARLAAIGLVAEGVWLFSMGMS